MSTSVEKVESPISFWSLLGPLSMIAIILIVNIRFASIYWLQPTAALVGLLLCHRCGWWGCLCGCVCVVAASLHYWILFPAVGILWTMVVSSSFVASLVVTKLLSDESQMIWQGVNQRSRIQADEIMQLEEKLLIAQTRLEGERQVLASRIELLKRGACEKDEKMQACDKLVGIVREELSAAHSRQEALLQELFAASQKAALLEQQLASMHDERSTHRERRHFEGMYLQMREQFYEKSQVLTSTRRELFMVQEQCLSLQKEIEERDVFSGSQIEQALYHMLAQQQEELRVQSEEYEQEAERLRGLVGALLAGHSCSSKS